MDNIGNHPVFSNFIKKETKTGQNSSKLLVKDEETVLNVVNYILGMFKAFRK